MKIKSLFECECLLVSIYGYTPEFVENLEAKGIFDRIEICEKIRASRQKEIDRRNRYYIADSAAVALAEILPKLFKKNSNALRNFAQALLKEADDNDYEEEKEDKLKQQFDFD